MTIQEKSLITFALFAYNQERFIREAVEGAFSQTYSPLEIILSDDCSSDCTFVIMEEMATEYKGPHTIILNRNERNLGIGGHVNRVMGISKGELIVGAAGDDISEPERTAAIAECYLSHGRIPCSIYSDANNIDVSGNFLKYHSVAFSEGYFRPISFIRAKFYGPLGSSHAWHRCLFDKFGPLSPDITYEDATIPFRASLLGEVIHMPQALVRWRRHEGSVFRQGNNAIDRRFIHERRMLAVYDNNLRDLMYYCAFINEGFPSKEDCLKEIFRQRNLSKCTMNIIRGPLKNRLSNQISLLSFGEFEVFWSVFKFILREYLIVYLGQDSYIVNFKHRWPLFRNKRQ